MNKILVAGLLGGLLIGPALAPPASAQRQVRKDMLEKTRWYESPREYQIIDDRPVVRDFREAPQQAGTMELPGAPGGGGGGGGAGALAGGPGSSIPGGGMQIGGPSQGFRSAPSGLSTLPRAGFGGNNSNMSSYHPPAKALPGAFNSGVMGKMMNQQKAPGVGSVPARHITPYHGMSQPVSSGPAVHSYSGGYGSGGGASAGGGGSRTQTMVRGSLLRSR